MTFIKTFRVYGIFAANINEKPSEVGKQIVVIITRVPPCTNIDLEDILLLQTLNPSQPWDDSRFGSN